MSNLGNLMADYQLRRVDAALWRKVKARAANEGLQIRQVLLALLAHFVRTGMPPGHNHTKTSGK